MKAIYKYPLTAITDYQSILLPMGAEFLSVLEQNDLPVAYFLVDPTLNKHPIEVRILGTGQPVEDNYLQDFLYLGTVSTRNGRLIWHVYAEKSFSWQKGNK